MRDTLSWLALSALLFFPQTSSTPDSGVTSTLANHASALGADALRTVRTRVTGGTFNNGRMRVPSTTYEKAPDKRVTVIGADAIDAPTGSAGRFDGRRGWDKNIIGTADAFRPATPA